MRKKYPFTKQEGLKDCAAACMQMIIKYYNGYISINDLNEMLETTKEGVSAFKIIEVSNKIGFKATGIRLNLLELTKSVTLPVIAHVVINNYNHYIVVYKIDSFKKSVIIADPQSKIKTISFKEFESIWTNVIINLYPVKPIEHRNYEKHLNYKNIILKNKKTIFQLCYISFIYMILSIVASFYMKYVFDNYLSNFHLIFTVFILFIIINLYKIFTNLIRTKILIDLNKNIDIDLSLDIFSKILSLPYGYYRNKTTGEIITRYTELSKIRETISKVLLTLFLDLPLCITSLIIMYFLNSKLTMISLIAVLLYTIIVIVYNRILNDTILEAQIKKAEMNTVLIESINGFETIKGLNLYDYINLKFENKYIKYLKNVIKIDSILNIKENLKEIVNQLIEMIIIFTGVIYVRSETITIGTLMTYNSILVFFLAPIRNLLSLDNSIIESKRIVKRVNEMLKKEENVKKINIVYSDILIKSLSFKQNEKIILNKINLHISKGEKVIITGKSGSGKSTLLKILMNYYNDYQGEIKINGINIKSINLKNVYISQNETLFTDTIYNNIVLGNNDSNFSEVVKMCYVDEIINSNLGYNQIIEENGFNISGGQKQRIILARSIINEFDLLLIDEGLNQIDVELERKILKNLFNKFHDKTIIIVSHRLENMDLYDKLIKLENGKVKECVKRND
ncbi:MAG: peptidase domain-containing ABC transporter [Tenericutes bacterium]|nr:peptidase domain-containing ABC transporter [Mycoplasmatota bacterium]